MTSEEFGQDLEHVEVLQKKFDEFQKVRFRCSFFSRKVWGFNRELSVQVVFIDVSDFSDFAVC